VDEGQLVASLGGTPSAPAPGDQPQQAISHDDHLAASVGGVPSQQQSPQFSSQEEQLVASLGGAPDDQQVARAEKFGTPGQMAATAAEGASQGLIGPVAPYLETKLGISTPENIRARQEENPVVHGTAETGTFAASMFIPQLKAVAALPAALGKTAEAGATAAKLAGITNKYAVGAAKAAAEMGLFSASDEATKAILQDPDQTVGNAAANIGMSAMMGGVFGSSVTGIGALARAGLGKLGAQDFISRMSALAGGLHPAESMEKEFTDAVNTYHAVNDETLGPQGLKAQAIAKLMPDSVNSKMSGQLQEVYNKANQAFVDMRKRGVPERLVSKFQTAVNDLTEVVTRPDITPGEIFDAMNDFKGELHGYSKGNFGPFSIPSHHEAYDFLSITKNLGREVRLSLEDSKVWGDVADLQKKLNASWSKILPAVKDVQSKFMEKVGGEYVPSSTKFNTYLNQNGKATTQTIRQQMMGNFVNGMENHFNVVDGLYRAAGLDNPYPPVSLGTLRASLDKPSLGTKLADYWYNKITPGTLGAGVGAAVAHAVLPGAGLAGAYLGKELLGPVFGSIIQPLMEKGFNSAAANHTAAFLSSAVRGETIINKAAKALFVSGVASAIGSKKPSDEDMKKLDQKAARINDVDGVSAPVAATGKIGDYLPNQSGAMAGTVQRAAAYLNSKRPTSEKTSAFSKPPPVSKAAESAYKRTLTIVQQPVSVFNHIRSGTLTMQDVQDVKTAYPGFYASSSRAIMQNIAEHAQAGESVPFSTQQMLSLYLGQPVNDCLKPASIQAAQPVPKPPAPPVPNKTKRGTSTLGKSNKNYQTPGQSAESDSADRD